MQHKLQEVFYSILVRVSHLGEALHNKQCWMYTAKAAYETPEPLNRKAHLLRFNRLATVTGKSSTWKSTWYPVAKDLALCESSYTRTQPWFQLWHSLFYHLKWSPVELYMGISLEPLTQRCRFYSYSGYMELFLEREREREREGNATHIARGFLLYTGESVTPMGGSTKQKDWTPDPLSR